MAHANVRTSGIVSSMWKVLLQRLTGKTSTTAKTERSVDPVDPVDPPEVLPVRDWKWLVMSWDGFHREAGLRQIRSSQSTERLASIIVRLNDWVPQVRAAARDAFADYLTPEYGPWLIAKTPAILALEQRRREDHGVTIQKLEALLATPECLAQTTAAFETSRGACTRLFFRVLAQTKRADELEAFLVASLHHADFSVRRAALGRAMALPLESAQKAIAYGLASNSSILRRLSFLQAIELQTDRTRLIRRLSDRPIVCSKIDCTLGRQKVWRRPVAGTSSATGRRDSRHQSPLAWRTRVGAVAWHGDPARVDERCPQPKQWRGSGTGPEPRRRGQA